MLSWCPLHRHRSHGAPNINNYNNTTTRTKQRNRLLGLRYWRLRIGDYDIGDYVLETTILAIAYWGTGQAYLRRTQGATKAQPRRNQGATLFRQLSRGLGSWILVITSSAGTPQSAVAYGGLLQQAGHNLLS